MACSTTYSSAPADAFDIAGDGGAEFLATVRTPAAPRKCAARNAAPRFCCGRGGGVVLSTTIFIHLLIPVMPVTPTHANQKEAALLLVIHAWNMQVVRASTPDKMSTDMTCSTCKQYLIKLTKQPRSWPGNVCCIW